MLAQKLTTSLSKSFTPATLSPTSSILICLPNYVVTSNQVTITGPSEYVLTASAGVTFSVNGGAYVSSATAVGGDKVTVRVTSQATVNSTQANYLYVGDGLSNNRTYTFTTDTSNFKIYTNSETFKVPVGVTSISMLCVGGSGAANNYNATTLFGCGGGGGGALSYTNNVAVTPGEVLTISTGIGGTYNYAYTPPAVINAGDSTIKRGTTILVKAEGGKTTLWQPADGAPGLGGQSTNGVGTVKYSGGSGGYGAATRRAGYGGASAKINANGTNGGTAIHSSYINGGYGIMFNGLTGAITYPEGLYGGEGALYGGGSSARTDSAGLGARNDGRTGVVVLAWGGRTFGNVSSF